MPFVRIDPLEHDLARHYPALRAIRDRRDLLASSLYRSIGDELKRVLEGVERGDNKESKPIDHRRFRAVAWNIQRGARIDELVRALTSEPGLAGADVLFLSEVDLGLGRSQNRNVARELAEALGMSYAFGVSYLTLEDDFLENPDRRESTLALAGGAILTRAPIRRVENVLLPELRDKFSSSEKRLGQKRALLAEIDLDDGPLTLAACHLDSNASPAQRASQLRALLDRVETFSVNRALLGGDLNTSTYDTSSTWALVRDLVHKLVVTGFRTTVDNYLTPDRRYDTPVFELLAERGFTVEKWNDRALGTVTYDVHDPYIANRVRRQLGSLMLRLLQWTLRRWNGRVPARLDWFAGRRLKPLAASVVTPPRLAEGRPISDHSAIVVEVGE